MIKIATSALGKNGVVLCHNYVEINWQDNLR